MKFYYCVDWEESALSKMVMGIYNIIIIIMLTM